MLKKKKMPDESTTGNTEKCLKKLENIWNLSGPISPEWFDRKSKFFVFFPSPYTSPFQMLADMKFNQYIVGEKRLWPDLYSQVDSISPYQA